MADTLDTERDLGVANQGAMAAADEGLEVNDPALPEQWAAKVGRLYGRTFTMMLGNVVTPEALVRRWRDHVGDFRPKPATFSGSITSIEAGDVAPITASGITTGARVIYADDTSFRKKEEAR